MSEPATAPDTARTPGRVAQLFPNTIRMLAVDAVSQAGSGHPGAPMGQADMAFVLWDRFLKFDPGAPTWWDRDRFVLSSGHACLLLYSLLHLYGYELSQNDLKSYRQWGSLTPGHPEFGHTPGVETTTGPLGQGIANAVGMALAERHLAAQFNRDGFPVVDHCTYCICSDGDLMEGVSAEAASLAGHLKLGKLITLYDSNDITIGGSTDLSFSEDVGMRFGAYGWHVLEVDGHDHQALNWALDLAHRTNDQPTLLLCRTHIGYGSPNGQDTSGIHGSPLSDEEARLTREQLGWPAQHKFHVPDEVYAHGRQAAGRGRQKHEQWRSMFEAYSLEHADLAAEFVRRQERMLPANWHEALPEFAPDAKGVATRSASGKIINAAAGVLPELMGGSADLEPSNKTLIDSSTSHSAADPGGRNIHFGVREHAMGSLCNGMAYHGGLLPFCATFLVFSDYQRPALRISALAKLPVVYVYTHDSIGVGGDGPTHQPIEHVESLRVMPGLTVIRPADANETRVAWQVALEQAGPTALILTRQNVPTVAGLSVDELRKGAYVALEPSGKPDGVILATGSELSPALAAAAQLNAKGHAVRVVSMPSWELFEAQSSAYKDEVLPSSLTRRLAVEAGATLAWWKYAGSAGAVLGIDHYGASAPGDRMFEEAGITVDGIVRAMAGLY
jgi:transketolase